MILSIFNLGVHIFTLKSDGDKQYFRMRLQFHYTTDEKLDLGNCGINFE